MTQINELAKQLRVTTERMANICSVDMETWNDHSNAALSCADALESQSTELTRLRKRNAELEKELASAQSDFSSFCRVRHKEIDASNARIASLESELDLANKQIVETGRAWAADRERLEAQLQSFREAAKFIDGLFDINSQSKSIMNLCYTAFMIAKSENHEDGGPTDWFTDTRPVIAEHIAAIKNDALMSALQMEKKDGAE